MARQRWWAVGPADVPEFVRIERASTAIEAIRHAFGRAMLKNEAGRWRVKDLGYTSTIVISDKQRRSAIADAANWFDPYKQEPKP